MKKTAIIIIGESWFSFCSTMAMLQKIKATVKKIARRWWLAAFMLVLTIIVILLIAVIIIGSIGVMPKVICGIVATVIAVILLLILSLRESLMCSHKKKG